MSKLALLIGVNEYPQIGNLQYAESDASAVAQSLKDHCGFRDQEVTLMKSGGEARNLPVRTFIESRLAGLRHIRDLDLLIVGFWGHGFRDVAGHRYLCATDTDGTNEQTLTRTGISLESLQHGLIQAGALNTCLILDCCQNIAGGRGVSATLTEEERTTLSRSVDAASRDIATRRQQRGYSVLQPPTMAVLNSCTGGQKA